MHADLAVCCTCRPGYAVTDILFWFDLRVTITLKEWIGVMQHQVSCTYAYAQHVVSEPLSTAVAKWTLRCSVYSIYHMQQCYARVCIFYTAAHVLLTNLHLLVSKTVFARPVEHAGACILPPGVGTCCVKPMLLRACYPSYHQGNHCADGRRRHYNSKSSCSALCRMSLTLLAGMLSLCIGEYAVQHKPYTNTD